MSISATGSVTLTPPASAVNQINSIVTQLRVPGVSPQQEAQLEQRLVQAISGANPSANWGMIATIANDVADPTVSTQAVTVDVAALDRMVQPTTGANLSSVIGTLAQQLRAQSPYPAGTSTLAVTALPGATSITLPSTTGMFNGDKVQITLDTGFTFNDSITTILNNIINLATPLPSQASSGNSLVNISLQQRSQTANTANTGSIVTTATSGSAALTTTLRVNSATGMNDGDSVTVQLADGSTLDTTIAATTASTTLSANGATNASTLTLASLAGIGNGEAVQIQLDTGGTFNTTISNINAANGTVTLATPLPSSAAIGKGFTATVPPVTGATTLTSTGALNANTITVGTTAGMSDGDAVTLQLDNGTTMATIIAGIAGNTVTLAAPLTGQASTGSQFIDAAAAQIGLATVLPVSVLGGATVTDTAGVPPSSNPIPLTSPLVAGASTGATTLSLASVGGMADGDTVQIALDNGAVFNTTLTNVDSLANTVILAAPLPSSANNLVTAALTDLISTTQASNAFTPAVKLSAEMLATLQLQLNVLIGAANPNANTQTLQTTLASLISSTLTTAQYQQDVTNLVKLAQQGLTPGTNLSILA